MKVTSKNISDFHYIKTDCMIQGVEDWDVAAVTKTKNKVKFTFYPSHKEYKRVDFEMHINSVIKLIHHILNGQNYFEDLSTKRMKNETLKYGRDYTKCKSSIYNAEVIYNSSDPIIEYNEYPRNPDYPMTSVHFSTKILQPIIDEYFTKHD